MVIVAWAVVAACLTLLGFIGAVIILYMVELYKVLRGL